MTDEEYAEGYEMDCVADVYKDDICTIPYAYSAQKLEKAYLDGLTKGRKEGFYEGYKKATKRAYERQQDLIDTYIKDREKIKQLEKENKELKEEIESLANINIKAQNIIAELKEKLKGLENGEVAWQGDMDATIKQNLGLKEQNKDLCESLDIMNNRESELLEQIEKMKNVGNCKHSMQCTKWNENQCYSGQLRFCHNCKEWELAE